MMEFNNVGDYAMLTGFVLAGIILGGGLSFIMLSEQTEHISFEVSRLDCVGYSRLSLDYGDFRVQFSNHDLCDAMLEKHEWIGDKLKEDTTEVKR